MSTARTPTVPDTGASGPARRSTPARRLERVTKRGLSRILAAVIRPRPADRERIAALRVRQLLVIRQHNQMGDMVCALPALRALRRAWPDARLIFVASPLCEGLLRDHPDVDELLVFRKQEMWRPWKLAALARRLRHPRPDLAVVMNTVSFSTTSALLAWLSGARVRTGGSSVASGSYLSRVVYNLELPDGPEGASEVEHNVAPLRTLGIDAPFERPCLVATPASRVRAGDFVERHLAGEGPVVVAHVGAGKLPNIWPAEYFARVLQKLRDTRGARIVLTEGPSDEAAVNAVLARLDVVARWRGSLADTLGLFGLARLVIANDTGLAHVAAAAGVPTIVLFGPTDPRRWAPPGDHVRVIRATTGRVKDVDPREVEQVALELLVADRPQSNATRPERRLS